MGDTIAVKLRVNGTAHEARISPHATLLTVLRDDLSLYGGKRGCNQGICGACTVLLDGRPVRACLSIAANCTDAEVTTIEGLARDGELSPIQQAMIDTNAVQCGFCTSGIIMTAHALLSEQSSPDRQQIRAALSGNLCRCSGYRKIVDAVLLAAQRSGA